MEMEKRCELRGSKSNSLKIFLPGVPPENGKEEPFCGSTSPLPRNKNKRRYSFCCNYSLVVALVFAILIAPNNLSRRIIHTGYGWISFALLSTFPRSHPLHKGWWRHLLCRKAITAVAEKKRDKEYSTFSVHWFFFGLVALDRVKGPTEVTNCLFVINKECLKREDDFLTF